MCPIGTECWYCKNGQHAKCTGWADGGGSFGSMVPCSCASASELYKGLEMGDYKLPEHPEARISLVGFT